MIFHYSLNENKSSQVSRTLLSILADLHNALVWIVSKCPLISKLSCTFTKHLVTVPKAPITTGTTVTFIFHSFFNSLARSRYLSFFSHSFNFTLLAARTAKSTILYVPYFLWIIIRTGRLAEIRWSVCIWNPRGVCISFSRTDSWLCIYHLLVWSNFNLLHNSL